MTKTQLENYIHLNGELNDLRRKRERLEKLHCEKVTDTVQGSSTEYPYTLHPIAISGTDSKTDSKLKRKIAEISAMERRIEAEEKDISQWIDTIPQSRMRRLMRYRYIDKLSWVRIAQMLKYDSADAARMAHDRYLKKF